MARRIMHIDLDAFFVSVEQALDPALKGKPLVVGGKANERGVVACASYEARAFGLHAGMALITAGRLCPQAIFIEGNFSRYRDASHKFMAILADFSPFMEAGGLDEAYLDVTGFESLHGSIKQMALSIKQRIKSEIGITGSIGIASNKLVAKVAAEQSKPDGLIEVPEGGERAFLAPLSISELPGIGKKSQQVLNGLGVRTIGQLAELPVGLLRSRFGVYGESIHLHARGIDHSAVEPSRAVKSISRETTFREDTHDRSLLEATLRYLSERVGAGLRAQGKQARCVTLKLRYADFTTLTRRLTLKTSDNTDQTIFETGLELLKKALSGQKQPVRLIGIGVSQLSEPAKQLDMLDARTLRLEQLNKAIDRIRDRYGFTSIQTGRTLLLKDLLNSDKEGYALHTPGLSR